MPRESNAPHLERGASRAGTVRSFALAFAVHGLLFVFLYFGIRWQSRPPAAIEAELWSEPPRAATPVPVAPPQPAPEPPRPVVREEPKPAPEPAPRKPDIAEKEEKKKPEPRKKEEKPKVEPKKEEKPKKDETPREDPFKAAAEKEINQREAANKAARELAALKSSSAETAANQRKLETWADQVRSLIRREVRAAVADAVTGNPEAVFEVKLLPGPRVGAVRKLKSSGNLPYDEAAQRAIEANERLPAPPAGVVLDPVLVLRMRPKED